MLASEFMYHGRSLGYRFQKTKTFLRNGCAEWDVYRVGDNASVGTLNKPKIFGQVYYEPSSINDNGLVSLACESSKFKEMFRGLFSGY